jgi:hypothetical protein
MLAGYAGCEATPPEPAPVTEAVAQVQPENESMSEKIKITIGDQSFTASLDHNPAASKLRTMLPLKLRMSELNGNEKYIHLSDRFPTDASNPGTIRTGDLMLYGADSLVLFYKTFPTTYSYTRIGRINDPAGLAAAVGSGDVTVTFDSE